MVNITKDESLLLQCLATTSFLAELDNDNFLNKDYFKNLQFENSDIKKILEQSGIGNPAALQMMLYALLVIPKEIWSNDVHENVKVELNKINLNISELIEKDTFSSYEGDRTNIDYLRHIRNAVSHAKCSYTKKNGKYLVTFEDKNMRNMNEKCSITMECAKAGEILMDMQRLIMKFYNWNHNQKVSD